MADECGCEMLGPKHENCGCDRHEHEQGYKRRFLTKAEKTEELKNYAEELKKELNAVEEKIKEMQSQ